MENAKSDNLDLISLFSGAGGMDMGFNKAGFRTIFANEYDHRICPTFKANFPEVDLFEGDIKNIPLSKLPKRVLGVIGGPPCQSWSVAGKMRGIEDKRGELFLEYIKILEYVKPCFFVAENVKGMLSKKHNNIITTLIEQFEKIGYDTKYSLLNSNDYDVPQTRERIFIVGFRKDLKIKDFEFPTPIDYKPTLRDSILDLHGTAIPAIGKSKPNGDKCLIPNHEYFVDSYSPMFMNRQRLRSWDEPGFTVQASGRQCQLHPQAPKMIKNGNNFCFNPNSIDLYRRMTIRECARIQTFPDDFKFIYSDLDIGYKMVGNAVPVNLAYHLAAQIKKYLDPISSHIDH